MAVQAQYPSNILLLNRNVQESKNIRLGTNDFSLEPQQGGVGFLDQSHLFFNNNGGVNPRKRAREITTTTNTTTTATVHSFNFSPQNQLINLSQLQNQPQNHSIVSTGLKLSIQDQNQNQNHQHKQQQIQQYPVFRYNELALQLKQQNHELNYFLHAQGEQLKRTLAEKAQKHYRALLASAENAISKQIQQKEAELETLTRHNAELESHAAQLTAKAQSWQAKAQAQEAHAVSLQAQIQQVLVSPSNVVGKDNREGVDEAEDAESVYVDPVSERRGQSVNCKACRTRAASVVLLPCRHMCVCVKCDEIVQACPVCFSARSASVEVYFS